MVTVRGCERSPVTGRSRRQCPRQHARRAAPACRGDRSSRTAPRKSPWDTSLWCCSAAGHQPVPERRSRPLGQLLAGCEQAERMSCGVEHHSDPCWITIRRLVRSLYTAGPEHKVNGAFEVVDEHFEVHHLRLVAGFLGPRWGLVRILGLEVESNTTLWVSGLHPASTVSGVDLPTEEGGIERSQGLGVGAVECDRGPSDRSVLRHRSSVPAA